MATDTEMLMGEMIENPEGQERDVEFLLASFLNALLEEQRVFATSSQTRENT